MRFVPFCLCLSLLLFSAESFSKTALEILELSEGANVTEIKAAYRSLMKRYHPDTNQSSNQFRHELNEVQKAYEFLKVRNFNTTGIKSSISQPHPEKLSFVDLLRKEPQLLDDPSTAIILLVHPMTHLKNLEQYSNVLTLLYPVIIDELAKKNPQTAKSEILRQTAFNILTHLKEDVDHPHSNLLLSEAMIKAALKSFEVLKKDQFAQYVRLNEEAMSLLDQLEDTTFVYDLGAFYQRLQFEFSKTCEQALKN